MPWKEHIQEKESRESVAQTPLLVLFAIQSYIRAGMSSAETESRSLAAACQNGDRRAASRLISMLESGDPALAAAASDAVARLNLPRQTIGLTGPPGAG